MTAGATLPDPPPAGQLRRAGIRDDEFRVVAPSQTWWRVHRIEAAFVLAWNEFRRYGPVLRFAPTPRGRRESTPIPRCGTVPLHLMPPSAKPPIWFR
jgi:hypothetical protein